MLRLQLIGHRHRDLTRPAPTFGHVHLARVNLHDTRARGFVGQRKFDFAIEATGTQQRRVKNVGTIGGGNHLYIKRDR